MSERPGPDTLHVVVPTHTTRHLALVLVGLARQTEPADSITISCDTDEPGIGDLIARWAERLPLELWWVRRAHHGHARLNQVRNNAIRHLTGTLGVRAGRVLVLDGDMLLADDALALHRRFGRDADILAPYRINLSEPRTASLDPEAVLRGDQSLTPSDDERRALRRRHRRARRHVLLRRLRLGPLHKPKLLGGHHSVRLDLLLRLNGYDEEYVDWGYDDDSFNYRASRLSASLRPCAPDVIGWHLYHPSRQDDVPMHQLPNARRFALRHRLPIVATHGIESPVPQHTVEASRFGAPATMHA